MDEPSRDLHVKCSGYKVIFPKRGYVSVEGADHAEFIAIMERAGARIVSDGAWGVWSNAINPFYRAALEKIEQERQDARDEAYRLYWS